MIETNIIDLYDLDLTLIKDDDQVLINNGESPTPPVTKLWLLNHELPMLRERRNKGRYQLREVAMMLSIKAGVRPDEILQQLISAVVGNNLTVHEPGRTEKYTPGVVRSFYEEAYWDDLNKWLGEYQQRVEFRFPKPNTLELKKISKNKSLPWWQSEYDIPEKAQAAGTSLVRKGESPSLNAVSEKVALEIEVQEARKAQDEGRNPRKISGGRIKNTALKGWKYVAD